MSKHNQEKTRQDRVKETIQKLKSSLQKRCYQVYRSQDLQQASVTRTSEPECDIPTPVEEIHEETNYSERISKIPKTSNGVSIVYSLGSFGCDRGVEMKNIGIDIGTKTIVISYRGNGNDINYISEINGYWLFDRATPFIENMLNDNTRVRSDGTHRPARWIKLPSTNQICVLGRDAEEFAFAKNDTLLRPMAEGGVSSNEESMIVLATLVNGLIEAAEKDVGKFGPEVDICYCTTAEAINKDINIAYHERVVNVIIDNYKSSSKSKTKFKVSNIKESHAIVLDMSDSGTGIGISWGAGTVTVSYVKYGLEIYSFCWVGAGDWIDTEVAKRHGYTVDSAVIKKASKETPTTVARRKHTIDLTPGKDPSDRIGLDIVLHYDVLISQVIDGIVDGFIKNENQARIDGAINIYMAGGTSSPNGFELRVAKQLENKDVPFTIDQIIKSDTPLYAVARGCLKASEMGA